MVGPLLGTMRDNRDTLLSVFPDASGRHLFIHLKEAAVSHLETPFNGQNSKRVQPPLVMDETRCQKERRPASSPGTV